MHHQALNAFIATEDFPTVQSMHKGIQGTWYRYLIVNLETFVYYTPTWLQISDSCNTKVWNKAAAKFPSLLFIAQPFVTIRNL